MQKEDQMPVWLVFCYDEGIIFFSFFFLLPYPLCSLEKESDPEADKAARREVFTRETALGFRVTTVVTYNEVEPPITRLLRRVTSFFDSDDKPPSQN